jgi:Cu2+-containing amine oxidase
LSPDLVVPKKRTDTRRCWRIINPNAKTCVGNPPG